MSPVPGPRSIEELLAQSSWLRRLAATLVAGEEAVTVDLLPLVLTIARERRLEEELYLTTFLWEEGKHVELFRRFLDEVCEARGDLHGFHTPSYRTIFYEELPTAMQRLRHDSSPEAQVRASVTYNMIVEGVLAETGYHSYFLALERNELMPGLREGLAHVKRDESRHIAVMPDCMLTPTFQPSLLVLPDQLPHSLMSFPSITTSLAGDLSRMASCLAPFSVSPRTMTYGAEITTLLLTALRPSSVALVPGAGVYST